MITKNTPIIAALRSDPRAKKIFSRHGLNCIGCMGSQIETIENCAQMHDINLPDLLAELNALTGGHQSLSCGHRVLSSRRKRPEE